MTTTGQSASLPDALTIDVEDYFHVSGFSSVIEPQGWSRIPPRIDRGLHRILSLLDAHDVRATFFVLGWVARRHPRLLQLVAHRGHEIGCHSDRHALVYTMSHREFREDLCRARSTIEDACGRACKLFRAPSFSITGDSLWALQILAEEGFEIDSSIFPVHHDRYGLPGSPRRPYRPLPNAPLVELPLTTVRVFGQALPCAGGGYLRIMPLWLTRAALRRVHDAEHRSAVIYLHPWELDHLQPVVRPSSMTSRLRHRIGLRRMPHRLDVLLKSYRFVPAGELIRALGGPSKLPVHDLRCRHRSTQRHETSEKVTKLEP